MEFTIRKLTKVKISNLDLLPQTLGLYFAVDTALRVWYLGLADKSIRYSVKTNDMYSSFVENKVFWIAYFPWEDLDDLSDWYGENIFKYNPPLNQLESENRIPITNLGYDQTQYLHRYKEIQDMIKMLEQEKEDLKPNIVSMIEDNDGTLETKSYKAWINTRKSYTYSAKTEKMKSDLMDMQRYEEEEGIAEVKSITSFPVVRNKR